MEGNPIENTPERIPTKGEVIEVISRFVKEPLFVRELSDEQGLYLFEVKVEGEKPEESIHYEYMRKGVFPDGNQSASSVIHVVYYENELAVGGHNIADYDHRAMRWVETE